MSGMSVASSIDRPISRAPSRSNLGPSAGSQHGHSHSSGSEEVRHILSPCLRHASFPLGCTPSMRKLGQSLNLRMRSAKPSEKNLLWLLPWVSLNPRERAHWVEQSWQR